MHGLNLFRFEAEIARLDTLATADETPGYDPIFREPKVSWGNGSQRTLGRKEAPTVRVRCQVETGAYLAQQMGPMGNAPNSSTTLVFKKRDLAVQGLVDDKGEPRIQPNDRLVAVRSLRTRRLVLEIRNPPGLFAVESTPSDFGYFHDADLVVVRFQERAQGTQPGG